MIALDHAVEVIRDRILSGQLVGGVRLGEVELANELGMSRTPVRQALLRLTAEGLVEIAPNRGARVRVRLVGELEYVFDIRARLEGLAARRAANLATEEQLDLMESIARELAACPPDTDLGSVNRLNRQFHGLLVEMADSSTLTTSVAGLLHASVLAQTRSSYDAEQLERSNNHHIELVAALRAHDSDWAESVMKSHLLSARASLLGPRRRVNPNATAP